MRWYSLFQALKLDKGNVCHLWLEASWQRLIVKGENAHRNHYCIWGIYLLLPSENTFLYLDGSLNIKVEPRAVFSSSAGLEEVVQLLNVFELRVAVEKEGRVVWRCQTLQRAAACWLIVMYPSMLARI